MPQNSVNYLMEKSPLDISSTALTISNGQIAHCENRTEEDGKKARGRKAQQRDEPRDCVVQWSCHVEVEARADI